MVLLQVLTVYSIHLCEFWCVLLPVFPWQHFPFQTSRHANPVDFFMDLVTPEVSTAEVKLFVNHYGQGLGGWWPVENLDQPKVQHPWGFYVKWGTLIRKSQPWHVVRKNNILSGDFLASEAREGGNDAIWWLHVFFLGCSTKDLEDLEVKIPTPSWFFVFVTNGRLRWTSMKFSRETCSKSCETSSFHMEKHNFLQMEAQTYFDVLV